MGVRLVKYGKYNINGSLGVEGHEELLNRDLPDQHPIEAITGLQEALDELQLMIEDISNIVNFTDTASVSLTYDETNKELKADVNIFQSEDNALVLKTSGLFVDKYLDVETEDTSTIHLTMEGKGETLETMYNTGTVFSHYNTWNNVYNTSEAKAWYYDKSLGTFVQPQNTTTFTGFVSTVKYRTYTHRATLKSTASDNDGIGLVIAYALDEYNRPHTLSVVINKGGEGHVGGYYYALVYDKNLPDEKVLFTKGNKSGGTIPGNHNVSGWNSNTITLEVNKAGATVTCAASDYGSTTINQKTLIEINLDDYAWGYLFRDKVQYGYCTQSQPYSYFQNIYFSGKGPIQASVIVSPDEGNIIEIRDNGLYAVCNGTEGEDHEEYTHEEILALIEEINDKLGTVITPVTNYVEYEIISDTGSTIGRLAYEIVSDTGTYTQNTEYDIE